MLRLGRLPPGRSAQAGTAILTRGAALLQGEDRIYECTFVETDVVPGCTYFATKCRLGKEGVAEVLPLPELSPYEMSKLEEVKAELSKNIKTGEEFAKSRIKA